MIDPEDVESDLPELDRTDDPRGAAVAWALLAVGVVLAVVIILAVIRRCTGAASATGHFEC
jgi:hypothetical protein